MNNFTFNQQNYLQIHGTAMGTNLKMALSFANIFLGMFELNALTNAPWQSDLLVNFTVLLCSRFTTSF